MRRCALSAAFLLAFCLAVPARAADAPQAPVNEVYLEVSALSTLYDLYATPEQLKALQALAAETVSKKPLAASPHPGKPYRSALTALRDAYIENNDDEIGDCDERLANLEDKMDNPPDPHVDITDAARKKVKDALKLFTPAQLAEYISSRAGDAPDPTATLVDVFDTVHGQPDKDFAITRKQTVDDLSNVLAGPNSPDRNAVAEHIGALLDKAHALNADDFNTQKPALDKEAHKLADATDPTAVLTHWLQRDMAELLSNPQLPAALAGRLK